MRYRAPDPDFLAKTGSSSLTTTKTGFTSYVYLTVLGVLHVHMFVKSSFCCAGVVALLTVVPVPLVLYADVAGQQTLLLGPTVHFYERKKERKRETKRNRESETEKNKEIETERNRYREKNRKTGCSSEIEKQR